MTILCTESTFMPHVFNFKVGSYNIVFCFSFKQDEFLTEAILKTWKKKELSEWLFLHGLVKSGNKDILINRVLRSLQFDQSSESSCDNDREESEEAESELIPPVGMLPGDWKKHFH